MKLRTAVFAASLAMASCSRDSRGNRREYIPEDIAAIARQAERMKACPDRYILLEGCVSQQRIADHMKLAKRYSKERRYSFAGATYANIGHIREARAMARKCKDDRTRLDTRTEENKEISRIATPEGICREFIDMIADRYVEIRDVARVNPRAARF